MSNARTARKVMAEKDKKYRQPTHQPELSRKMYL